MSFTFATSVSLGHMKIFLNEIGDVPENAALGEDGEVLLGEDGSILLAEDGT